MNPWNKESLPVSEFSQLNWTKFFLFRRWDLPLLMGLDGRPEWKTAASGYSWGSTTDSHTQNSAQRQYLLDRKKSDRKRLKLFQLSSEVTFINPSSAPTCPRDWFHRIKPANALQNPPQKIWKKNFVVIEIRCTIGHQMSAWLLLFFCFFEL